MKKNGPFFGGTGVHGHHKCKEKYCEKKLVKISSGLRKYLSNFQPAESDAKKNDENLKKMQTISSNIF